MGPALAGELGLGYTFWVTGHLGPMLIALLGAAWVGGLLQAGFAVGHPQIGAAIAFPAFVATVALIAYAPCSLVAIWRAARRTGGFWAISAQVWVVLAIITFLSAHHPGSFFPGRCTA